MTELTAARRSRTDSGLEAVIQGSGVEGTAFSEFSEPALLDVLALVKCLDTFIDLVRIAEIIRRDWPIDGQHRMEAARLLGEDDRGLARLLWMMERDVRDRNRKHLRLSRISMNSPLAIELVVSGVGSAGVVSAVVYLFKNPDKLGEWFPKLQTSWYNGRAEAEKAKKAYEKLRKARTQVRELER